MSRIAAHKVAPRKVTGVQYAALPWRLHDHAVEILLITSRRTKRWIIPKGWPMDNCKPAVTAAREAAEEAGVSGEMGKRPVGHFSYQKLLRDGVEMPCRVEVFPLKVMREKHDWDEKKARERRWFSVREAAGAVMEPQLKLVIRRFGAHMAAERRRKQAAG
ncbi:MAG TPA: NUDIX hydrolase [Rhizomicrobium sp.]|nr:NUDIX hydrolase [Rhizomicrobium sp.]